MKEVLIIEKQTKIRGLEEIVNLQIGFLKLMKDGSISIEEYENFHNDLEQARMNIVNRIKEINSQLKLNKY